jgi:Ankyrin repeats (many copies)
MIQHGADVNAQVTGTKTYSMRVSRAPSANEGMTALHSAVQGGRIDMVKYLVEKGANTQIVDASGRKPIDMLNAGGRGGAGAAPTPAPAGTVAFAAATSGGATGERPGSGAGRGGPGGGGAVNAATAAEIRAVLESAAAKK